MAEEQEYDEAVLALAEIRGEPPLITARYLQGLGRRLIPSRLIDPAIFRDLDIVETGLDWPYAYVRLGSGKTFYSWPSSPTRVRQFWLIRNKLPKTINPDTFGVATDIARRYVFRINEAVADGGTVIEGGAYVGIKALRFADEVGSSGKIVAIEVDRANFDLMCLNIEANGLGGIIAPVHAALSSADGNGEMTSGGRQKNSITKVNGIPAKAMKTAPTITLDSLIDEYELSAVDFLNLQVNGAEAEALAGCERTASKIGCVYVATRDRLGGSAVKQQVVAWLTRQGYTVDERERSVSGLR